LRFAREPHEDEIRFGIEIVLSGLIHNPQVSIPFSTFVRKDLVDLAQVKIFAFVIPDAERKPGL
jgi:hypothetical protein